MRLTRSSDISDLPSKITPDLISDYVAGRLDADDAHVVEEALEHDKAVATAVAAARKVKSRMARSFAAARSY